ncbi:hypothetical protein HRbin22_01724 [Candidatus Thermoflexus japonica]|uniref:DUF4440 domain-containing protein n=1 Tax=Candidatus Thermoflexus japonica TaxID=2035417 RepID=A0A2H5Y7Q1_9CHLR|nr:hypothetical protein HRbin22_01724 [Candidatus Thermoflexus japonica]
MDISDERAIQGEMESFIQAWNAGDAPRAAAFFAPDAVRVGVFGDIQHGREAIREAMDMLLHTTMRGARLRMQPEHLRMLSPELALTGEGVEIALPDGSVLKGYAITVWKKVEGRWLMLEAHPKLFPPLLPAEQGDDHPTPGIAAWRSAPCRVPFPQIWRILCLSPIIVIFTAAFTKMGSTV